MPLLLFLLLVLAHIVGEFLLRPPENVSHTLRKRCWQPHVIHATHHGALASIATVCFIVLRCASVMISGHARSTSLTLDILPNPLSLLVVPLGVSSAHLLLLPVAKVFAFVKTIASRSKHFPILGISTTGQKVLIFLGKQSFYMVSLMTISEAVLGKTTEFHHKPFFILQNLMVQKLSLENKAVAIVILILCATVISSEVIQRVIGQLDAIAPLSGHRRSSGQWIGYMERLLLMIFVVSGEFSNVTFIVAAKSLIRLQKFEEPVFAEYFLIGTLVSVLCGILCGLALRWMLT